MDIRDLDVRLLRRIVADAKNECVDRIVDIILFGSYAKGTATEKSDIDIAIVLKGTLKSPADWNNTPKSDYETMRERHNRHIHMCVISERDYYDRKEKEFKDVPDYGISILNI